MPFTNQAVSKIRAVARRGKIFRKEFAESSHSARKPVDTMPSFCTAK